MITILIFSIVIALSASWAILLLKKLKVVEWLQIHGSELISELANCDFCLSWWTCLIISVITAIIYQDYFILLYAIIATPICRKLL